MGGTAALSQSVTAAASAYAQSNSIRGQGEYESSAFNINASFAEMQAEDALKQGEKAAKNLKKQVKLTIGAQRANMAAQGIELDSGSALEIQEDTAVMGELDALTIKNNAYREAWGFKVQAEDFRSRAQYSEWAARNNSRNTLLTGGLQSAGYGGMSFYEYSGGSTSKSGRKDYSGTKGYK